MIRNQLRKFRKQLTSGGEDEPLNKLSIVVIILLDLFVLNLLFYGLSDHTKQLTSPDEYLPRTAREVFIDGSWSPSARMAKLEPLVLSDWKQYRYQSESLFDQDKLERMNPLCRDFYERIGALSKKESIHAWFVERERLADERNKLINSQDKTKRAYDTQLFETIAGKTDAPEGAIAARSDNQTRQIEKLTRRVAEIEQQIDADADVQALWILAAPENEKRAQVIADFRRFDHWYPVKELGWQLVFLLLIFFIFLAWNRRSAKHERWLQILISSHLLVICFLPILFKIIELVVDLIPNHFFRNLFKLLKSLHLIAVWHYLVIIGAGAIGLLLVFLIQKKVFSRERTMQKRLSRGACIQCGKKIPTGAASCPYCGTGQMMPCGSCEIPTPSAGAFCIHCGAALAKLDALAKMSQG